MYDITLIFPNSPFLIDAGVVPPLGILYLTSHLEKAGFSVQCLDIGMGHTKEMAEASIIGISFSTPQRFEAYELLDYYKSQGKKVIAGGPHPSHMPFECIDKGFDIVFKGEADKELPKMMKNSDFKNLRGIIHTCKDVDLAFLDPFSLTGLPLMDYKYTIDNRKATTLIGSRGCPYGNCSFCARIHGTYRQRLGSDIKEEIEGLRNLGFSAFMFFDDVFIYDKERLKYFAYYYENEDVIFRCFGRSDLLLDRERCSLIKKMGVVEVGIGVESGSTEMLKRNMKGTTKEVNAKAIKILKDYGIRAKTFIIVGLPGETEETVKETEEWLEENKPDDVDISIFQPLPGSRIFNNPEKWGISFCYNGEPLWYKGTPGKYHSSLSTEKLTGDRIVELRDQLEAKFKKKELLK